MAGYDWYTGSPIDVQPDGPLDVDARQRGMMTTCKHNGQQLSKDGKCRCKYYDKSRNRECCMYYNETIKCKDVGICDKSGK